MAYNFSFNYINTCTEPSVSHPAYQDQSRECSLSRDTPPTTSSYGHDPEASAPTGNPQMYSEYCSQTSFTPTLTWGENSADTNDIQIAAIQWNYAPDSHMTANNMAFQHAQIFSLPISPIHGVPGDTQANTCNECGESFLHDNSLADHAKATSHAPYLCHCGAAFSRLDVLMRHIRTFDPATARFPCTYCTRFSGPNAFSRKDHLANHLRNYHKIEDNEDDAFRAVDDSVPSLLTASSKKKIFPCCHQACSSSFFHLHNPGTSTFQTQSDLTKHMREVHDESPFPCPVQGCVRCHAVTIHDFIFKFSEGWVSMTTGFCWFWDYLYITDGSKLDMVGHFL
ncbi:hypothetical protein F5884DRAFT_825944 [Xylogone sp. PMI_703]|nr:hypothetical protein F5884DRAFT_825944 [Xylogone sp. PMI_703]